MHIESLEFFQKIAKLKSISKVANSSHISQSALSQQMQRLEESLGFELFVRSNRGVELTEGGNIVLKYSDHIIRTYKTMMEQLENQQNVNRVIKIEAARTIASYCLPRALYRMKESYPSHQYELVSGISKEIEQNVLNDICDLGFITTEPLEESLSSCEVVNENIVLIALANYDIPDKIILEELFTYPLILLKGDCIVKERLEHNLKNKGTSLNDLNILFEFDSTEAVKALVLKGYGISFLPYTSVKKELCNNEMKVINLKDMALTYSIFLINKPEIDLNGATVELIEGFKKLGNSICC